METVAAYKLIGAGLAAMGAGFAAIGVGLIFGMFLQGALRNPAAADKLGARLIFGFAVAMVFLVLFQAILAMNIIKVSMR